MTRHRVTINRAPVLTLWAAVVAERLGYDRDESLTLGKAVAGLNAQSKGQRLGIYAKPTPAKPGAKERVAKPVPNTVELMGRLIPVTRTKEGVRAVLKDRPTEPASVERYLEQKFGDSLDDARAAMAVLARSQRPADLARHAFALYESFRPRIPEGQAGWGAEGALDLDFVRALAKKERA